MAFQYSDEVQAYLAEYGSGYRVWIMFATVLGSFSTLLAATSINVAIPDIMGAFGLSPDQAQWMSTGFLAATTTTMLLTAWSVENYGLRATYNTAMVAFLFGSVLGGVAPSFDLLILARLIQGAAAGIVTPIGMIVIAQIFAPEKRGMAMGILSIGMVLAPAMGPTLGGVLIEEFSWRYVFFASVPATLVAIPLATTYMTQRDPKAKDTPLDSLGAILVSAFLTALLVALADGQKEGWNSDYIVSLLVFSGLSLAAFLYWEWHNPHPMLDLRLFKYGSYLATLLVSFVVGCGIYGSTYLLPLFMQTIQGTTPTSSGLLFLPGGLLMVLIFPLAGRLSDFYSNRNLIMAGLVIFAISTYMILDIDVNTPISWVVISVLVSRIGLGLIFPVLSVAAVNSLPLSMLAQGSGTVNFFRQIGGAFGINLLATSLSQHSSLFSSQFIADQRWDNNASSQLIYQVGDMLNSAGTQPQLIEPGAIYYLMQITSKQADVFGFQYGFYLTLLIFIAALIPAYFIKAKVG